MGDIDRNKLRFGYSGMRFRIRVSIQGSGTRISGYPLRSLIVSYKHDYIYTRVQLCKAKIYVEFNFKKRCFRDVSPIKIWNSLSVYTFVFH